MQVVQGVCITAAVVEQLDDVGTLQQLLSTRYYKIIRAPGNLRKYREDVQSFKPLAKAASPNV